MYCFLSYHNVSVKVLKPESAKELLKYFNYCPDSVLCVQTHQTCNILQHLCRWRSVRTCSNKGELGRDTSQTKLELLYLLSKTPLIQMAHTVYVHALQVENVSTEVRRLSRCLSQDSFPSSEYRQTEGDTGEQANMKKVGDLPLCRNLAASNFFCSLHLADYALLILPLILVFYCLPVGKRLITEIQYTLHMFKWYQRVWCVPQYTLFTRLVDRYVSPSTTTSSSPVWWSPSCRWRGFWRTARPAASSCLSSYDSWGQD